MAQPDGNPLDGQSVLPFDPAVHDRFEGIVVAFGHQHLCHFLQSVNHRHGVNIAGVQNEVNFLEGSENFRRELIRAEPSQPGTGARSASVRIRCQPNQYCYIRTPSIGDVDGNKCMKELKLDDICHRFPGFDS